MVSIPTDWMVRFAIVCLIIALPSCQDSDLPLVTEASVATWTSYGGRQYVVVAAGGHWGAPNPPGDHLMAYALRE
jgi:hypothetical protein